FTETFSQFIDVRKNKPKLDAAGYRQFQRADLAVVDHGRQRTRALGTLVTLLEQRKHSFAKRGEHDAWPLAPKKIAAQLAFKELYRACQRRLSDMALLGRAREIQRPRDGQEVPDLVHFHAHVPPDGHQIQVSLARFRTKIAYVVDSEELSP